MASDQSIITQITEQVIASLPSWFGDGARLRFKQPERLDRAFTVILNYTVVDPNGKETRLVIKLPRERSMHTLQEIIDSEDIRTVAVQRAEILRSITEAVVKSGNQDLTAIQIYGSFPEHCAIVMEHRSFKTFKQLFFHQSTLLRGNSYYHTVEQAVFTAGQWVSLFHNTFRQPEDQTPAQMDVISRVNEIIGQIETLTGKDHQPLRQAFAATYDRIKDTPTPVSSLHNDLTFNNLFVTDAGKIGGFDPTPEPPDSIYLDLARILADLATRNHQVTSLGMYFSERLRNLVESSFMRGYGSDLDTDLLNFYLALLALEKWLEYEFEDQYRKSPLSKLPGARNLARPHINRYFLNLTLHYLTR